MTGRPVVEPRTGRPGRGGDAVMRISSGLALRFDFRTNSTTERF
jgi:hypothetical protein